MPITFGLHDGRVVTIDPFAISHTEYRQLIAVNGGSDEAIIAKCTGLGAEEIDGMAERDWRGLVLAVARAVTTPDPP